MYKEPIRLIQEGTTFRIQTILLKVSSCNKSIEKNVKNSFSHQMVTTSANTNNSQQFF